MEREPSEGRGAPREPAGPGTPPYDHEVDGTVAPAGRPGTGPVAATGGPGTPGRPSATGAVASPRPRSRGAHSAPDRTTLHRRRFIGLAAAGGVIAAGAAVFIASEDHGTSPTAAKAPARPRSTTTTTTAPKVVNAKTPDGVTIPVNPAIVAENAKTGHAWWVNTPQQAGDIEGYANVSSAQVGDTVTLFVSTKAAHFHVEAYRMGYYQGIGARLVYQSDEVPGTRQAEPVVVAPTNTIECNWNPSITLTVDKTWPPGAYLLKLVGPDSEQQYVPLCVRDDTSKAAVVIQHSITTWQAYNRWGGYSLYYGNAGGALSFTHDPGGGSFEDRARIVSFDRPYDHDWASGAADFVGNEFPVVYQAEQLGLDVTYWTDVDFHARPQLLTNHKALISLGHDEYWSLPMRTAAVQGVAAGVNMAFLGANACYRQIRMEPSSLGDNRHQVCYKSAAEDPMTGTNDTLVTVNWPQSPVDQPESELIGSTYQDIGAMAPMVVVAPDSWLFAGTGFTANQALPRVVQGEFDRYVPGAASPANLDVVAHSVVANRGGNYSDITWYTVPNGGGVFASGNATFVGALPNSTLIPPNVVPDPTPGVTAPMLRVMENLYSVIAMGPAAAIQPSQGTWTTFYGPGTTGLRAPVVNNAA